MAEKPKSVLLPVMAAAVFAGLGRMVVQKIRADRAARKSGTGRGGAGRNRVAQNRVGLGGPQRRGGAGRGGKVGGGGGQDRVAGPVDEKTRQWISEVVRTPRQ